jgi:ubiquinone/menaquinone biosynthesis C-methylase UbiE
LAEGLQRHENYQISEEFTREVMGQRTAQGMANFLLPHLRPGMRLLECGCGQGTVTVDLAELVAPGEVVGIDLREGDLDRARALADQRGVANVSFQTASIYELPFPDGAFDAVFANAVLMHLGKPLAALQEMRRVVKSGGVAGIRDPAFHQYLRYPTTPALAAWDPLYLRTLAHHGGSPTYGASQRELLRAAGFALTEGLAQVVQITSGTMEATRRQARMDLARMQDVVAGVALAEGWASQAELDEIAEALRAWGEHPDAFYTALSCCAIAWA